MKATKVYYLDIRFCVLARILTSHDHIPYYTQLVLWLGETHYTLRYTCISTHKKNLSWLTWIVPYTTIPKFYLNTTPSRNAKDFQQKIHYSFNLSHSRGSVCGYSGIETSSGVILSREKHIRATIITLFTSCGYFILANLHCGKE